MGGGVSEALNNKADIDLNNTQPQADYVIEYKRPIGSDKSWYRLWKSEWLEQGGYVGKGSTLAYGKAWDISVPLIKEYIDTNYSILVTASYGEANADTSGQEINTNTQTTKSFDFHMWNRNGSTNMPATIGFYWKAEGYTDI